MNIESIAEELEQIEQDLKKRPNSKHVLEIIKKLKRVEPIVFDELVGAMVLIIESKSGRLYELWLNVLQKVLRVSKLNED